ncbi:TetR/AcrR family transcriptional regulator [Leucobacter insecticola]|uniref:TetR/AcrR family transcriptional regulator n=1 Tax=Leucobacter insecticola TaxID=2714934 RepID=UPI001FCB2C43|nr:TetR/AcrR family transcriptional regulator [Leucobacter insecticola]
MTSKRARLDQRMIVDALLELARDEPKLRPTFKRLGEALGVDATAMYRHFRNRDELIRAALDRLQSTAVECALAAEGSWRERLEAYLERAAELSLEFPSVAIEGAVLDPVGPGDVSADELILGLLSEGGLAGEALIRGYAAVSGFAVSQGAALAHEVMRLGLRPATDRRRGSVLLALWTFPPTRWCASTGRRCLRSTASRCIGLVWPRSSIRLSVPPRCETAVSGGDRAGCGERGRRFVARADSRGVCQ